MNAWVRAMPRGARMALAVASGVGAVAIYVQLLPGSAGSNGTPAAVAFSGLVVGSVTAVTAAGLVLVYRSLGAVNFAQTALGAAGAELTFQLVVRTDVPFVVALVLGLALAATVGLVFDVVAGRRLAERSRTTLTAATVAVTGLTVITVHAVSRLPFFDGPATPGEIFGTDPIRAFLPFPGFEFQVGGFPIPFGFAEILALEVSLVALLGVGAFLRFTRLGIGVRAMAANRERVTGAGADPGRLSATVWVLAGLLGGVSVILFGALTTPGAARGVAPAVLLPALAAAVVGRFRSIPQASAAALAIGVVTAATRHSFPNDSGLVDLTLAVVVVVGLLLHHRREPSRRERSDAWAEIPEPAAIDPRARGLPAVQVARRMAITVGLAGIGVYPYVVDVAEIRLGGTIAVVALLAMSLVVLSGWAGQLSLGQWAFAGVGAVVAGALTTGGLPFWLAVPVAAAATAVVSVAVGFPALRLRGPFLAVATLAFAYAVSQVLFDERYFGWLLPDQIDRPTLFFLDFADERSMFYLSVAAVLAAALLVRRVRAGSLGRALVATRDNPEAARTFGVSVVRARLTAFAISGLLAGTAGALFAHQQGGLTADAFAAERSVELFLIAVVGGLTSIGGVAVAAVGWEVVEHLWSTQPLIMFLRPFLALTVLVLVPAGLIMPLVRARDAAVRLVARRSGAPLDRRADARLDLAAPRPETGLGALPPDERFALPSALRDDRAPEREPTVRVGSRP